MHHSLGRPTNGEAHDFSYASQVERRPLEQRTGMAMKMFRLMAAAACGVLAGASCSAAPHDGDRLAGEGPKNGSAIQGTESCEDHSVEQCAGLDECRLLYAVGYDLGQGCRHESEPVGCIAAGVGCGDAMTYATDPAGATWLFPDTCIPGGWQVFSDSQADRDAAEGPLCSQPMGACRDVPLDGCADAGCRVLNAIRYDRNDVCRYPSAAVGCIEAGTGCADAMTYAIDPAGGTWSFGDLCIPDGWQVIRHESQADRDAAEGPPCR